MMTRPGTFERVYASIKDQLRAGMFRPGARLQPMALSDRLNASVTPVRDALHRLTGERLVEAPRHEGFRAPVMTETMLRDLYAWHLDLLLLAVARRRHPPVQLGDAPALPGSAPADARRILFQRLAASTGNPEHASAFRNVSERLEPFQRFEERLLDELEPETRRIGAAIRHGDRRLLRKSLLAYHRRRQRIVPRLLASLQGAEEQ